MPEIVVKQNGGGNTEYIPERLCGIKIGDILVFRPVAEINAEYASGNIRCGWNQEGLMDYLVNDKVEITVDESMMNFVSSQSNYVKLLPSSSWSWQISLDMLMFKEVLVVEVDPEAKIENLSFFVEHKDKEILKTMISMVDFKRFHQLLRIGTINNCTKEKADELLKTWAENKYEFFLLFGKKLSIETEIESVATPDEMRVKIEETLYSKFPKYIPTFILFSADEYVENQIYGGNDTMRLKMPKHYIRGSKLSGFFADLYNDKELNDSLARVLGNRKINAKVSISIDPYDYLTMSTSNYGWKSCHRIGQGEYGTGTLALMLDNATLVSYKHSGKNSNFEINNYAFEGNNKSWRSLMYVDKNTSSCIFSRHYPSFIDPVSLVVRELYEQTVSDYLHVENIWKLKKLTDKTGYNRGSNLCYHDVLDYGNQQYMRIQHKNVDPSLSDSFTVGQNYSCLKCGENPVSRGTLFLCGCH